jgi:transcriptional regulator with XRE-family HTH domain
MLKRMSEIHSAGGTMTVGQRLMDLRKSRGLSMRELADRSGASTSLISQIETGKTNPSVGKLQRLAAALDVPVTYFFDQAGKPERDGSGLSKPQKTTKRDGAQPVHPGVPLEVVRSGERAAIELGRGVTWERLTPCGRPGIEFLQVTYPRGASSGPLASHYGEEFVLVIEGTLELEFAFDTVVLSPGDSLVFDSTVPHRVSSVGDVAMRAIWVNWTRPATGEKDVVPGPHVYLEIADWLSFPVGSSATPSQG